MDTTVLPILLLLAHAAPSLSGPSRDYHLVNEAKTWSDAQQYCRENYAELAILEREEDTEMVKQLTAEAGETLSWIGHYDGVHTWKWSLDNTTLFDGDQIKLGSWFDFQPDNAGSEEHCGSLLNGVVADTACDEILKSVCYDEPSDSYVAVPYAMRWPAARAYCKEKHTDLASMTTEQQKAAIMSVVDTTSHWWLGLTRDSWLWTDGSQTPYQGWVNGAPHGGLEICGCVQHNGWNDTPCTRSLIFVCSGQRKLLVSKGVKVTIKSSSALDPNDPLVQEAIRKHMEKTLRDHGVQENVKLRWQVQPNGDVFDQN